MSINRIVRVNELLKREIAEELVKQLDRTQINAATVMVSRVETSPDLKMAEVFISIIGDEKYQRTALQTIERTRAELQREINRESHFKFTPRLTFTLDHSIAEGDHILGIIAEMEEHHPEWTSDDESENEDEDNLLDG